jgi:hypothetical protein
MSVKCEPAHHMQHDRYCSQPTADKQRLIPYVQGVTGGTAAIVQRPAW